MKRLFIMLAVVLLLAGFLYLIRPIPLREIKQPAPPPPTTYFTRAVPIRVPVTVPVTPPPSYAEEPRISQSQMQVMMTTDKDLYMPGQTITAKITFRNISENTVKARSPTVIDISKTPLCRQAVYLIISRQVSSRALSPGESVTCQLDWDQRDLNGKQVPCGYYCFQVCKIWDQDNNEVLDNTKVGIVNIGLPKGAINKTILVDKTLKENNITVILQKVELSDSGIIVYAQDNLDGLDHYAWASYNLDSGWAKSAGMSYTGGYAGQKKHHWIIPEPVPVGTRELIFVIEQIGKYSGPWMFTVPLE